MADDHQGEGLRAARIRAGLTQDEVARRAEISVRTVRHIERGQVNPRPETLARLSQVVGYDAPAAAGRDSDAGAPSDQSGYVCEIRLLGPLVVLRDGQPVTMPLKQRALLGLLAVQSDQTVSHEEIADVLWSGEVPAAYTQLVHTYVARLRRIIEPGHVRHEVGSRRISTVRGGYVFNSHGAQLDLRQFDERVAQAMGIRESDPVAALELLGQVLGSWHGRLLQDLPQLWQHPAVVRVAQRHIDVAIEFADLALRQNRPSFAVEQLRVASYEDPLHEALQARIMLALAGSGRRAAALQLFADLRERLRSELGVELSEEIWQARQTILMQDRHDPGVDTGGAEPPGRAAQQPPYGPPAPPSYGGAPVEPWDEPAVRMPTVYPSRPRSVALPAQLPSVTTPFVGRREHMEVLDGLLAHQREKAASVGIAAIHGPAEVGKTALAVRWAHHRHERFPDGQLYADLQGSVAPPDRPVRPRTVLTRFLHSLGVQDGWIPDTQAEASALFRSLLAGRNFLVVLDDAANAAHVRSLLPGTPGNLVVVTSRSPLMDLVTREGALPIALDVLSAAEAYALIEAYLGAERTAAEPDAATELAAVCGHHPLQLRMAVASLAAMPHVSIRALVTELVGGAVDSSCSLRPQRPSVKKASRMGRTAGGNG